jgi:hypothetical protein
LDVTSKGANEDFTNIFIAKFFEFVKRVIYLFAAFLVFTMIFKNVSFSNELISISLTIRLSLKTTNLTLKRLRKSTRSSVMSEVLMKSRKKLRISLRW